MNDVRSKVEHSLQLLRSGLTDDGADLEIAGWPSDDQVDIALTLRADACQECIVSTELLTTMVGDAVRRAAPEITRVRLSDPRTAAGSSPSPTDA